MANQVLYGFFDLAEVFDQRVQDVGVQEVTDAVTTTLEEHNRQLNALISLFVQETDQFKLRYQTVDAARLQPLDETGRARPIQPAGYYEVGFPIQDAGIAYGANWRARQRMTVGEVNRTLNTLIMADKRWMRDHILAALFDNVGWTFPDEEFGDLSVKGLANGDTDTYLIQAGQDLPLTDTHYMAQANAISDADDPFENIYQELVEHPENGGDVIAFVPTAQKASVQGLTGFHKDPDPNIQLGANSAELVGELSATVPGTVLGYHDAGIWIVEWPVLPAGYLPVVATGGERPLAMRQDSEPSLRGFQAIAEREDYPYWERQYIRRAGFGAWNRVGAVVLRVGNGTYAIPTNYSSPMA